MAKLTFEDVCRYAELSGCEHRQEPSRAKDYTGQFFTSPWTGHPVMILYEGPRRIPKGKETPEVQWWAIDSLGNLAGLYSRTIRMMTPAKGLAIGDTGYEKIMKVLNGYKEDDVYV